MYRDISQCKRRPPQKPSRWPLMIFKSEAACAPRAGCGSFPYRSYKGTSLIKKTRPRRTIHWAMPVAMWCSLGGRVLSYERSVPVGLQRPGQTFCSSRLPRRWGGAERFVFNCRTTGASTAPCLFRRRCFPTHCAGYCAPCQPLLRAFSRWIQFPPSTPRLWKTNKPHKVDQS